MRTAWPMAIVGAWLVACGEPPPKMHLEKTVVATREDVVVVFDDGIVGSETNQYWVALQPADAPISDTAGRVVLERGDRMVRLHTSSPGAYEVRLHGRYPNEETHLLVRVPVVVEGWPVQTGIERRNAT